MKKNIREFNWNGLDAVEMADGVVYVLDGWNGEAYHDCQQLEEDKYCPGFYRLSRKNQRYYEAYPIYEPDPDNEDSFIIVDYDIEFNVGKNALIGIYE